MVLSLGNLQFHALSFLLFPQEKSKWSSRTIEIEEEVESRARVEYESKLAAELALMREQTQEDMRAYQMQIDTFFRAKFDEMKRMSDASISSASKSKDELLVFRRRLVSCVEFPPCPTMIILIIVDLLFVV